VANPDKTPQGPNVVSQAGTLKAHAAARLAWYALQAEADFIQLRMELERVRRSG
jgi:hypothetical protein